MGRTTFSHAFDNDAPSRMKRAPRALQAVIAGDATLAGWQARRAREERLTRAIRAHLPRQLGERIDIRETDAGAMELVTTAGAIAAAVKQRLPDLRVALQREGFEPGELRVRVQVSVATSPPPRKAAPQRLDRAAAAPLASLAKSLPAGPLRDAIAKLLRRAG